MKKILANKQAVSTIKLTCILLDGLKSKECGFLEASTLFLLILCSLKKN